MIRADEMSMGRGRGWCLTSLALVCLSVAGGAACQEEGRGGSPPDFLVGDFVDDYGIRYSISAEMWVQGSETRYEIVEWDVEGRTVLARNADTNPTDAGLWTRIDWVTLDPVVDGYAWAFCYVAYDAESADAAMSEPPSSRDTPRTGCGGFPFSRMRRPPPSPSRSVEAPSAMRCS